MIKAIKNNINRKRRRRRRIFALIILSILLIWTLWSNLTITVTEITVDDKDIPVAFMGFRILQLSDIHSISFGENNERLLDKIDDCHPDIIVITGDLVDMKDKSFDVAIDLVDKLTDKYPVYYVNGNHEAMIEGYFDFENQLIKAGVCVLANSAIKFERNGVEINIIGVDDPTVARYGKRGLASIMADYTEEGEYSILLSHRPELFDEYCKNSVDLVFTGHAHGGQFRIPFIGGVYAPGQGLFPKYQNGKYTSGETTMVVSRGIGNSIIPFRFNNAPELVVVELAPIIEEGEILNGT